MPSSTGGKVAVVLAATACLTSLVLAGFVTGIAIATRVLWTSGVGWDAVADALAGGATGAFVGLVGGILAARRGSARLCLGLALGALLLTIGLTAWLRATRPRPEPTMSTRRLPSRPLPSAGPAPAIR